VKTNACRILDELGLGYETLEYAPDEDELGAEAVARKIDMPLEQVFKTLVARGDRSGVLLVVVPGSSEVSFKKLASSTGNKRVELVDLREVQPLTGYVRGGVSPLGARKKLPVIVDEIAEAFDRICVSAGVRGMQLLVKPQDLIRAAEAQVCDVTQ
jgi:Cys-tRNA(Pro)/Cys-tRNA(Cys) deacylase